MTKQSRIASLLGGIALAGAVAGLALSQSATIAGPARVVDGDTIQIGSDRIRLWGIDAFENAQLCEHNPAEWQPQKIYACGRAATQTLEELIRNKHVTCHEQDRDRYRRIVARCLVGTTDLGQFLVRRGWAVDYTRYSHGYYKADEDQARTLRMGAWAGKFEYPWDYRHK